MRYFRSLKLFTGGVLGVLFILGLAPAGASSANISHSYHSTNSIANGSLVSLDPSRSDYVQSSNTANGSRLLGIAVAINDSLLAVDSTKGDIQVATSGTATALVSTLNGDIKVGDRVAVSPFNGVGMKSVAGAYDIGLAQTALNSDSEGVTTQDVTDKSGKKTQVQVGYIRLNIAIGTDTSNGSQSSLNSLQKIAKSLTGHTVSTTRVIVSIAVAVVAIVALVTLIYVSIYASIISVGRNPLADHAVFRTLGYVLAMTSLLAAISGVTIFLLLR